MNNTFSTGKLLEFLGQITKEIEAGSVDISTQQDIWDRLVGVNDDPDLTQCIFLAWWINYNLRIKEITDST